METRNGHGCGCGTCTVTAFTRNNYFTGKLLLERDFTEEQQYHRDKIRHHNQRLHGAGVVCGLEVVQHPSDDCRNRFVRLEPGTAIDCCGNEILVVTEEDVDLTSFAPVRDLDPDDEKLHEIQICLRYHECGTEPVPVLYDECGCDDDRCAPNRILESFQVDVRVDPPASPATWTGPRLVRQPDIPLADVRAVLTLANGELVVGAGQEVHLVAPAATTPSTTVDVGGEVHGLELAAGGSVYVAHDDGGGAVTVSVLDSATFTITHTKKIASSAVPVKTAMASDGRLLVLMSSLGVLATFATDLETGSNAAPKKTTLDKERSLLAAHPSKALAYAAAAPASPDGDPGRIDQVDLDASTVTPLVTLAAGLRPIALGTAVSAARPYLLLATDDGALAAYDLDTGTVTGAADLFGPAVDVRGAPWAYATGTSGGQSRLQPVGTDRLVAGRPDAAGPTLGFAGTAVRVVVAASADTVYVGYLEDAGGGVAVFHVEGGSCRDAWDALRDCDACAEPDCVPVATIHGYRAGFHVLDPAEPPSDPVQDAQEGKARIDNLAGRLRLRSTAALQATIECLLDGGTGGGGGPGPVGPRGPQGLTGPEGPSGPQGLAGTEGPSGPQGLAGTEGPTGPAGTNGTNGAPGEGLEAGLTRIEAISWLHAGTSSPFDIVLDTNNNRRTAVIVQFTEKVLLSSMDPHHVFYVEAPRPNDPAFNLGYRCQCRIDGTVVPVTATLDASGQFITDGQQIVGASSSAAVAFLLNNRFVQGVLEQNMLEFLAVRLHGEFVLDVNGRAVDVEFTRAGLPTGDRPQGSVFGVQGGLFQSWFEPRRG